MYASLAALVLLILVIVVSLWVGRHSSPVARAVLVGSALAISALLFLPTWVLRRIAGRERVESLQAAAQTMSLTLPDIVHFVAFAALAALLWTLRPDLRGWRGVAVLMVLAVAAELTQVLTSRREPRLGDVAINLVGAAVGVLLARMFVRPARSG
ncbi:VanZ family protein [Novilysobacter erysipheiresistens]|uniref:VanZ family protein n=1 Tax=Novilysobacter erysipheiresistens TaxID=1749332 RepID=A0ABU7YV09_9GAMM